MIELKNISKSYKVGSNVLLAIKNLQLTIEDGEFVSIIGPSGSGKSTLLHLIGGLDTPSDGSLLINHKNISHNDDRALSTFRNKQIGFVFQDFHLLNHLTLEENISLPLLLNKHLKLTPQEIKERTKQGLIEVELLDRAHHKPTQVSGGQKQRAAIARALINHPQIILADEPTGNLDSTTGGKIIHLLKKIHQERKITLIIITHDQSIASHSQRIIEIKDGQIGQETHPHKLTH